MARSKEPVCSSTSARVKGFRCRGPRPPLDPEDVRIQSQTAIGASADTTAAANAQIKVYLYYWDDRDGSDYSGWWFGPQVGGDQVWAYNSERAMSPPTTGWRVPYDGPMDTTFVVNLVAGQPVAAGATQQAAQQPQAYAGAPQPQAQQGHYTPQQQQVLQQLRH